MKFLLVVLFIVLSFSVNADGYRCSFYDGRTMYQRDPCPDGIDGSWVIIDGVEFDLHDPTTISVLNQVVEEDDSIQSDADGYLSRSQKSKDEFKHSHPCPSTGASGSHCPGYVVDHIKALACGGSDEPSNM